MSSFDLTGKKIRNTYQRLTQISGSQLVDGTGSLVNNISLTGSFSGSFIGSFADGIEVEGGSSLIKSTGFLGQTSASQGSPAGFVIYSGSSTTQLGGDTLQGTGFKFVGPNNNSSISFTDQNDGDVEIKTDKFTLQNSGDITASNALFSGTAIARNFVQNSVIITGPNTVGSNEDTNFSDYMQGSESEFVLRLDGGLGGDIVNNVEFRLSDPITITDIKVDKDTALAGIKSTVTIKNRIDGVSDNPLYLDIKNTRGQSYRQTATQGNLYTLQIDFPSGSGSKIITAIAATDFSIPITASSEGINIKGDIYATNFYGTASYAVSASHEITKEVSSSFADTASYVNPLDQNVQITGSLDISGSGNFTDGLNITGSFNVSESIIGESDSIKSWTISAANAINVNGQDSNPTGVWFDPTGSRMYMCGYSKNDIFEYSLTTPFDVLTATYTGKQFDFGSTNGSTTEGMYISPDGVECYAIGRSSDRISRYRFSTPWDVSTLSFSQSLNVGSSGTPRLNLESNPQSVHFKYDGSILYFMGFSEDTIYQVPLTTPWDIDISNHGTITSQSINPPHSTPTGMSLSQDGTTMLLIGYSADRITKFTLSTPYDVQTLTQVEQSPYYAYTEATSTNIYWNETYNKVFTIGRSSDRIFQLNTTPSIEITDPQLNTNDLTISGSFTTFNTGRFLFRNPGDFAASTNFRSTFTTFSSTRLTYGSSGTVDIGNLTSGNLTFTFAKRNVYPTAPSTSTGATFNIVRNEFGGKGRLRIGIPSIENESYYTGTRGINGITHITSDADTFNHFGSFTLGGELQVSGSSREVFLTKQEDLYSTLTPIIKDTFTEASDTALLSHTPDTGSGYTLEFSSSGVSTNDLPLISGGNGWMQPERDEDNDGYIFTNQTTPSIADYEVRATIRRQQSSDDTFWIFFRYIDDDNFYGLQLANNTSYSAIWKKVGGTSTKLSTTSLNYVNTSTADNLNIDVAIRGIGDKITLFYEGEYRGTWIDSDITAAGKAGFGFGAVLQDTQTSQEIDDNWRISEFKVTEFPSSIFSPSNSIHYIKDGNVGIGTTSPTSKLHVVGDGQGAGILLSNVDGYNVGRIYNNNSNAFPVGNLTLSYGNTTPAFINAESNGISIRGGATNTAGNNIKFKLYTSEQMRLTPTGLGIGTTSPQESLHIHQSGADTRIQIIADTTRSSTIFFGDTDDRNAGVLEYDNNGDFMRFFANAAERMRITSTGYVGIGTTSPGYNLEVSGSIGVNNDIYITHDNGSNPSNAGSLYFRESSTNPSGGWGTNFYGFRINHEGSSNYLNFQSANTTTVKDILTLTRDTARVGIGTTAPSEKLDVVGTVKATSFVETSAKKFKENIEPISSALESVTQLQGVSFNRIGEEKREHGFIADEVQNVIPELVSYDANGEVHGVHYARTVAVLTEAIKELDNKVKVQDLFIKDLVDRIEKLENK